MVFTANRNLVQSEAVMSAGEGCGGGGGGGRLRVDHLQLPCEYHQAIIAGLSLAGASLFCVTLQHPGFHA